MLPTPLEQALERLLLCNQIRELASYPRPVKVQDVARLPAGVIRVIQRVYRASQRVERKPSTQRLLRWILVDAASLVGLRLFLSRGRIWHLGRETIGTLIRNAVFHQMRYHARPAATITGYVRLSVMETALIRTCLLLRTLGRHGACIELLLQRLHSGLPRAQTREWLAFFLREGGEPAAAEQCLGLVGAEAHHGTAQLVDPLPPRVTPLSPSTRLTYGMIVCAMFDSPVFRSCLRSILASDFQGRVIVAEDGHQTLRACEAFCQSLGVTYVKCAEWGGPTAAMNLGLRHVDPKTDIAMFSHSDVLYPPEWFYQLNEAWERVYDTDKVGIINLGYLQFPASADAVLRELFVRERYRDLAWILRTRREIPPHMEYLFDLQNTDGGRRFGLGRDNWGDRPAELHQMTGKCSAGASFLTALWKELGGFAPDMGVGFDIEMNLHCCRTRRWNLWINNTPLIHFTSADSAQLGPHRARWAELNRETYERFPSRYGWTVDHFYWTYFSEVRVLYEDQIVDAVNRSRFGDVDFVFDELEQRLQRRTLRSCEFQWCRVRHACPHP